MPTALRLLVLAAALLGPAGYVAEAADAAGPVPREQAAATRPVAGLQGGQRWLDHFRDDLLPFWNVPDAWGVPRGNFPTFRCNDGRRLDPQRPCPELAAAPLQIKAILDRRFVRMQSRQTYFYGVAYHLTGDPKMLELARDGVQYLRANALEKATGSAVSWLQEGAFGPRVLARTSQDLAYAQLGMAMYYYLTRDAGVLEDLLRLEEHIFGKYWDARWGMLRWVVEGDDRAEEARQELVAQLDQVNAYLLLLAPILPEPHRARWKEHLVTLARVMIDRYYAPDQHLFWGTIHSAADRSLGSRHTDFGHTAKALWMIERIGRLTGEKDLVFFAHREGSEVLKRAFLPESGSWGSRPRPDGSVDPDKEWWIYAELDQLAATLALLDRREARYLARTYDYWLRHMVDHRDHEVWGFVRAADGAPSGGPKIHQWKSGYHSAEHALVAYLTGQVLRGEPATLYYAFAEPAIPARPYFFSGRVVSSETAPLPGFGPLKKIRVAFQDVR